MRKSGAQDLGDALPYSLSLKEENVFIFWNQYESGFRGFKKSGKNFENLYPFGNINTHKAGVQGENPKTQTTGLGAKH
jgi:hypothetical protein